MSLRAFHIVFVTLATLFCVFLALWAFWWPGGGERDTADRFIGVVGVLGTLGLPVYGVYFYRKARNSHL
jgi:hypothetical protein